MADAGLNKRQLDWEATFGLYWRVKADHAPQFRRTIVKRGAKTKFQYGGVCGSVGTAVGSSIGQAVSPSVELPAIAAADDARPVMNLPLLPFLNDPTDAPNGVRSPMPSRGVMAVALAAMVLSGCQSSGSGGVLGSVLSDNEEEKKQIEIAKRGTQGENPNAATRLANTRNALTDYCPAVRLRAGTETFRVVPKSAEKDDLEQVRYQATITNVARECAYVGQDLVIKVGARGRVITGPKGQPGQFEMPIRVAVTQGENTVYSKLHRPQGSIADGRTNGTFSFVDDKVVIPAPTSTNVRVFIGFDEGPYNTP